MSIEWHDGKDGLCMKLSCSQLPSTLVEIRIPGTSVPPFTVRACAEHLHELTTGSLDTTTSQYAAPESTQSQIGQAAGIE